MSMAASGSDPDSAVSLRRTLTQPHEPQGNAMFAENAVLTKGTGAGRAQPSFLAPELCPVHARAVHRSFDAAIMLEDRPDTSKTSVVCAAAKRARVGDRCKSVSVDEKICPLQQA